MQRNCSDRNPNLRGILMETIKQGDCSDRDPNVREAPMKTLMQGRALMGTPM